MHKIPVWATVGNSYRFFFRDFWTMSRLVWFLFVPSAVIQFFAWPQLIIASLTRVPSGAAIGGQLTQGALSLVAGAILAVAVNRRLLLSDDDGGGRRVRLQFGRAEIWFIFVPIILILLTVVIGLLVGFAGGLVIAVATRVLSLSREAVQGSILLLALAGGLLAGFIMMRLLMIYPIRVVDGYFDYRESWHLTRGNFWRLFAICALVLIPPALVIFGVSIFVGRGFAGVTTIEQLVETAQHLALSQAILTYVTSALFIGLGPAAVAYSFKALRGVAPDEAMTL